MEKENIVVSKSIEFALNLIPFCEILENNKKFVIANQLLKSGTSVGANYMRHKMQKAGLILYIKVKIAAKELEETKYWLLLCEKSPSYPFDESLKMKINELGLIVYKILSTSKNNR